MNGADLAVLVVPFLDGSSNRVEAGTDLEDGHVLRRASNSVRWYGHVSRRENGHVLRRSSNSVRWYGHVSRRENGHVLRRSSKFEAKDQRKKGRLRMTWMR